MRVDGGHLQGRVNHKMNAVFGQKITPLRFLRPERGYPMNSVYTNKPTGQTTNPSERETHRREKRQERLAGVSWPHDATKERRRVWESNPRPRGTVPRRASVTLFTS
jgi:hypothetical protein